MKTPWPLAAIVFALFLQDSPAALGAASTSGATASPAMATLEIAGQGIERLTLEAGRGQPARTLVRPSPTVSLPPGDYRVQHVELAGGFSFVAPSQEPWFTLRPGETHRIILGAPLRPTVRAERQGHFLQLDYELRDAGGRLCQSAVRQDPPRFTIEHNGEVVATGVFQFG